MPSPEPNEKQQSFIARYLKDKRAKKDFPDLKQRLAVAYSEYKREPRK